MGGKHQNSTNKQLGKPLIHTPDRMLFEPSSQVLWLFRGRKIRDQVTLLKASLYQLASPLHTKEDFIGSLGPQILRDINCKNEVGCRDDNVSKT